MFYFETVVPLMIMKKRLLFATQIYHQTLLSPSPKSRKYLKSLIEEAYQIMDMDQDGVIWSKSHYKNGYTSYSSQDQLHRLSSTFHDLELQIRKHVKKYIQQLDYCADIKDLIMTDFWVNIMPQNTIHTAHIHPQSVISGTFYVSTPKNCSSIQFEDPRLGYFMNAPQVNPKGEDHNQRFIQIEPKAGELVLFESWLKHEVPLNSSKEPRISVSFNYGWK